MLVEVTIDGVAGELLQHQSMLTLVFSQQFVNLKYNTPHFNAGCIDLYFVFEIFSVKLIILKSIVLEQKLAFSALL